jgi:hypothetical protein
MQMNFLSRAAPAVAGTFLVLCTLVPVDIVLSQVSTRVSSISPAEAIAGAPLTVTAVLARSEGIQRAVLVYRPFGESDYRRAEMDIRGTTAQAVIPGSAVQSPSVEYYIVFATTSGTLETYPLSETADPFSRPPERTMRLTVAAGGAAQVLFLSPEADLALNPEDVVISFSLLRADTLVDRRGTRVLLDGVDVTAKVVFSGEIGVIAPENTGTHLGPGTHAVSVRLFTRSGKPHHTASMTFSVMGEGMAAATGDVTYFASVSLESRRENVASQPAWYNRGAINLGLRYSDWRFVANTFLTSDEKSDRQPQDRYFIGVESPWIRAGYGDQTPTFPDLILSGMRVRGVHASAAVGFFSVAVSSGQTSKPIEGALLKSIADTLLAAEQLSDPSAAYARLGPGVWGKYSFGTYERSILAVRPSFSSGEHWELGFTWMHSQDETGSITTGSRPQENVVLGMDFVTRLDDRRIELAAQGAFSAYNSDISSGTITDQRIGELFPHDSSTVREVRDILSRFITVNENLRPLSLRRLSTAAGEASLQLHYFDNVLKFTYLYRGSDYTSFGQSFLRKDVQGFNVNDRVRLVDNSLLLAAGYEQLNDNTSHTKAATTTYGTVNIAVTYAPGQDVPVTTIGYSRYDNANGLPTNGPDSLSAVSDVTNRLFVQSSYDFTYGAMHTASINFSTSDRSDATARGLDVNALTLGLSLATRYGIPLTTSLDVALNFNKLPAQVHGGPLQRLDYSTIGVQARYELIPADLVLQGSVSPTFGDFKRTVFDLQTEWTIYRSMRLIGEFSYFKNDGVRDDNYLSLRYRYDL